MRDLVPVLESILINSEMNGQASETAIDVAYWQGSIDTVKHILLLMEEANAKKEV